MIVLVRPQPEAMLRPRDKINAIRSDAVKSIAITVFCKANEKLGFFARGSCQLLPEMEIMIAAADAPERNTPTVVTLVEERPRHLKSLPISLELEDHMNGWIPSIRWDVTGPNDMVAQAYPYLLKRIKISNAGRFSELLNRCIAKLVLAWVFCQVTRKPEASLSVSGSRCQRSFLVIEDTKYCYYIWAPKLIAFISALKALKPAA
ncbi:hypothetical protein BDY19DRAFT_906284 [Irpex rosettiformis]|uniref:Uncharacterized protein n=1 Tax=Irpex rosettiformis TaxID=378272 RepID=A0ACB8U3G7_9APHY|nr:hypothetical protein BDY19DRAFT_906284 [Irpex rosettiformis]